MKIATLLLVDNWVVIVNTQFPLTGCYCQRWKWLAMPHCYFLVLLWFETMLPLFFRHTVPVCFENRQRPRTRTTTTILQYFVVCLWENFCNIAITGERDFDFQLRIREKLFVSRTHSATRTPAGSGESNRAGNRQKRKNGKWEREGREGWEGTGFQTGYFFHFQPWLQVLMCLFVVKMYLDHF